MAGLIAALMLLIIPTISGVANAQGSSAPPMLDGLVDPVYLGYDGRAIEYEGFYPQARATLYVMEQEYIDSTYIWLAWIISKDFNDASYGINIHSSWTRGHNFTDLYRSDLQRLDLENSCEEMVVDATMDLLEPGFSTPSTYGVSMSAGESVGNYINGGDWSKFAYETSMTANLNRHGYCIAGICSILGTDLTANSPNWADDPTYTPASPYDDWEYDLIWEVRVNRDVFRTASCPQGGILGVATTPIELHASPSKINVSPVTLFPVYSSIGDYVWLDANRDGVQDAGEPGIPAVTLALYSDPDGDGDFSDDGSQVATTITDADGRYLFPKLGSGNYVVDLTDDNGVLVGLSMTPGSIDPHSPISLGTQDRYLDADFGYAPSDATRAAIGDFVWSDADNDGIQDPGEPGIGNVTLELLADYDGDGSYTNLVATTTTAADGSYLFMYLLPGDYRVDVTDNHGVLAGRALTIGPQSSADPTGVIHINAGDVYITADFGYYQAGLGAIGNLVWYDTNGNGTRDAGEPGTGGVTLNLLADSNGNGVPDAGERVVATVTADDGSYQFSGLLLNDGDGDADYLVTVTDLHDVLWRYRKTTGSPAGADDRSQRDPYAVALSPASPSNVTADFGYWFEQTKGLVGDRVWYDLNGDGLQDGGEPGIRGVMVELWKMKKTGGTWKRDTQVGVVSTDANGNYYYPNLPVGNNESSAERYQAEVTLSNFDPGRPLSGFEGTNQPDRMDESELLYTGAATVDLSLDFGYGYSGGTYSIGDTVWYDSNSNGLQDDGSTGIASVTLALYRDTDVDGMPDGSELLATTTTNASGGYLFSGLPNGDYIVVVTDRNGRLIGYSSTYGQHPWPVTVSGASNLTIDFGYVQTASNASIGDRVWQDVDGDGVQDGGEAGLSGITVDLYRPGADGVPGGGDDTLAASTWTNASGYYTFTNLTPGNYYLQFERPPVYVFSPLDQGGNDAADSDANPSTGRTAVTTLVPGENDTTWDAGLTTGRASIGDRVWEDLDNDGLQDSGEYGLAGVTVNLFAGGGSPAGSTTTDGSGNYGFGGLAPGDYYVVFTRPPGYSFSPRDQGADDTADSDADTGTGQTATTTLTAGENDVTWDAGMWRMAAIGDRVWVDTDGDGLQDAGESGLDGVAVRLYDPGADGQPGGGDDIQVGSDALTASGGLYSFPGLVPGSYFVEFVLPGGYAFSPQDQGASDAVDSDASTTTGRTAVTALTSGENDTSWDAGLYRPAAIGDYLWVDTDADGIQDTGEAGYNGATVHLYDPGPDRQLGGGDDILKATTTTAGGGRYSFSGLAPGSYYVRFVGPGSYVFTLRDRGTSDTADSDANPTTGWTAVTSLVSGENDTSWDAGLLLNRASVGDLVWHDLDGDGVQDVGEPGIANGRVQLYTGGGSLVGTAYTNANGYYYFTNLNSGTYYLVFTLRAGYSAFSPQDQGGNDTIDSDANVSTGRTADFALSGGTNDVTRDAGMYNLASIGDWVWVDSNGNGLQDSGESGRSNVTVRLYRQGGTSPPPTALTDAAGGYRFTGLIPGSYYVEFVLPSGFAFSPRDQGASDALDSDADTSNGRTVITQLTSGENDLTWDAGIYQPAALGDYVWLDSNRDGLQAGESGYNGATVRLYQEGATTPLATTITAGGGLYAFTGLTPGNYFVEFALPAGYVFSPQDQGSSDTVDSDAHPATGRTTVTTLTSGETDQSWDAGLVSGRASIGDWVWYDSNYDGVQDLGEGGMAGVTVQLYLAGGSQVATASTGASGSYGFSNLEPGDYTVRFVLPAGYRFSGQDQGGNDAADSDADPNTGQTASTSLSAGENDTTWDAGMYLPASISNYVWEDLDQDGVQDASESGLSGVTVRLYDSGDNLIATTTTNSSGGYIFAGLVPGDYYVEFVPPADYAFSLPTQGGDGAKDSDADLTTGRTAVTTLSPGENDPDWDAGLAQMDFGDLRDTPYRTVLTRDGARHVMVSGGPILGATVDAESDGRSNDDATGDDTDKSDDEDGVIRIDGRAGNGWTNGTVASGNGGGLRVIVSEASGVPQAFMDFGSGYLSEVTLYRVIGGSPAAVTEPLDPGSYQLYFDIPAGTFGSGTVSIAARTRISRWGGLGAFGTARNGEVEDYLYDFGPTAVTLRHLTVTADGAGRFFWLLALSLLICGTGVTLTWRSRH